MQNLYHNSSWWTAAGSMRKWSECLFRHSLAVADLALQIGLQMGVSHSEREVLQAGGFLHDLGKASWPQSLVDRCPLAETDWQIIKTHPLVGAELAREMGCSKDEIVLRVIREHHEHGDKAYPAGYKDLHPLSRIVIVAELYTAMTEHRPYRPQPLSCKDALHILSQNGHNQIIVKALEQVIKEMWNDSPHPLAKVCEI
ncbi:MAG: HD domain-containing protein [Bacillota bacterium]